MRQLCCLAASILFALSAGADVVLLDTNAPPIPIFLASTNAPLETRAARQLAATLEKISGAPFAVQTATSPLPGRAIVVGALSSNDTAGLKPEDFRLRAEGGRLFIAGGGPRGTLYGVYAFLEDVLGCRWWSRTEEDIPHRTALTVPDMDRTVKQPFAIHNVWNLEAWSEDNDFAMKAGTTSAEYITAGHSLYPLLTAYATNHPGIYPMDRQGQRRPNQIHFCYLAPGLAEALADALEKEIAKRNGDVTNAIYFAGMGDAYGGLCQCEDCRKVYDEETWTDPDGRKKPGYTATLLRMINRTAEILGKKYPGVRVGTFAYMDLEAPPAKTKPRDNVMIRLPRIHHCSVHPAETCPKNRSFVRNLEGWIQLAGADHLTIWEYGANFRNFLFPFPCLNSMADNLKFYRRLGIHGVEIQGNYTSTGGDLAVLKNHVWSKLFRDPTLDTQTLVRDFCRGYYGPAAESMLAYVDALEKSVTSPQSVCADEFAFFPYLTPNVRQQLERHRDDALKLAGNSESTVTRVREATFGIEAMTLWKPGPLEEKDGQLIRTDLGGYTYPRAEFLVKYLRGSSDVEWDCGPAATMRFLTWHGGPLVTLTNGDVTVTIAPSLNGQIRQITFKGRPLLPIADPKEKGYPVAGGILDTLDTHVMKSVGEVVSNSLTLEGYTGIRLWSEAPDDRILKTITLAPDGLLTITATAKRLLSTPSERSVTFRDTFPATGFKIDSGAGSKLPDDTSPSLPSGNIHHLWISFPKQGCMIEETFHRNDGTVTPDENRRTLTVEIVNPPVPLTPGQDVPLFQRTLRIKPLAR